MVGAFGPFASARIDSYGRLVKGRPSSMGRQPRTASYIMETVVGERAVIHTAFHKEAAAGLGASDGFTCDHPERS